jgi:hypothetical protein
MSMESHSGMILTGENQITQSKTCLSVTLSTPNPTWTDPGANQGLHGDRSANYCLTHGTALKGYLTKTDENVLFLNPTGQLDLIVRKILSQLYCVKRLHILMKRRTEPPRIWLLIYFQLG